MPLPKQNDTELEDDELEGGPGDTPGDDEGGEGKESEGKTAEAPGDQDDGSFVVELDDDAGTGDGEGGDDDRLTSEEDEAERARIREERRQERQLKKQRAREEKERLQREVAQERERTRQLEERLAAIERRNSGAEVAQVDQVIGQTEQAYRYFKDQIKVATEAGDGAKVAEATEKMVLARERLAQLNQVKVAVQQRQNAAPPLDPRLVSNAQQFMNRHKWYRPDGQDMDSQILRNIDNAVANEGWDPTTPQYWEELENRVKKYLPHRIARGKVQAKDDDDDFEDAQSSRPKPKSAVAGSGEGSGAARGAGGKQTFKLSAERVQALKEAGMWDDPAQRQAAIKRFRDYDRQHAKGGK